MGKLIEIDPSKIVDPAMFRIMQKINMARVVEVNKMIAAHVPKWKIYLLQKSQFFARLFKLFTVIEPQTKLESDLIREKLILYSGTKENPKKLAEAMFFVQDKRKLQEVE